jgi:hypothetical protein
MDGRYRTGHDGMVDELGHVLKWAEAHVPSGYPSRSRR